MSGFTGAFSVKGQLGDVDREAFRSAGRRLGGCVETWEEKFCLAACAAHGAFGGLSSKKAASADGKVRLFLEGEIFDLEEADGGAERSEAEHCLSLHLEGRLDELERLNGSFALLILDARGAPRLLLATDRLCSRPIYVFHKGGRCFFSTDMAALLSFPPVGRRLCLQGLVELFAVRRTSLDHTLYEDVRVVPAASIWCFGGDSPTVKPYWRMRWKRAPCSRGEAPEALAEHLRKAVRRRVDDGECALLLSGGLDARAVLAAADRPLKTITLAPFENAEARAARRLAEATGGEHVFIRVPPGKVAECFFDAASFGGGNYIPPFNFLPAAAEIAERCEVVLSGYGIDYTVRGMYMNNVFVRLGGSVTQLPRLRRASKDRLEEQVAATLRYRLPAARLGRIFQPPLAAECEARLRRSVREALAPHDGDGLDPQNGWDSYTLCPLSKHYTFGDLLFLRHFVQTRTPAYDRDLFDFFLSMPPAWRCSGKVFRKALQILSPKLARLPTSNTGFRADMGAWTALGLVLGRAALRRARVISRPSIPETGATHGSWADFPELLRTHPLLKGRLDDALRDPEVRRLEIFDLSALEAMVREDRRRLADHGKALTLFLTFASWNRRFPISDVVQSGTAAVRS